MAKLNLTAKTIAALKPGPKRVDYFDPALKGFCLRVTPAGVKTFSVLYRRAGRLRRHTLGTHPPLTLADAREAAREALRDAAKGKDPAAEKKRDRTAETVAELVATYLEKHASKKRSGGEDRRQLERDVLPKWGRRKAKDIRRRDVIDLIDSKADAGAPIAANRLLAVIRKMFNWAVKKDLLESSPCVQVEAPGTETARTRVLSADEIRQFWERLDAARPEDPKAPRLEMSPEVRSALKLLLILGQRPNEIAAMERLEIDESGSWWTIPQSRTKANRTHHVPLTDLAKEILATQKQEARWVFPSPRGDKPIHRNALSFALRRNREYLGLKPFAPHDLRRSCSDWMARLGVDGRWRSAVLNHREQGVTERNYTAYTFDKEKEKALKLWEVKLREIITGEKPSKVVSIA